MKVLSRVKPLTLTCNNCLSVLEVPQGQIEARLDKARMPTPWYYQFPCTECQEKSQIWPIPLLDARVLSILQERHMALYPPEGLAEFGLVHKKLSR